METPLTAFVVDVGSLSVRCGYSGDDVPRQLHASCVGIQSPSFTSSPSSDVTASLFSSSSSCEFAGGETPGALLFPLTFSEKRRDVAVQPCLYPTFSNKSLQPSYTLHEEVFEALMLCCIEGPLFAERAAAAGDEENMQWCPLHSMSSPFCCSHTPSSVSSSSSSPAAVSSPGRRGTPASAAAAGEGGANSSSNSAAAAAGTECTCSRERRVKEPFAGREWRLTELCGLGESLCDFPLLLSEPNLHCRDLREKLVEIAFERLASPAVYVAPRAQLSCLSLGRSSGMVVDIGAAAVSISPVIDGFVLHQEVGEWPAGGNFLDQLLACALRRHRLPLLPLFAAHKKYAACSTTAAAAAAELHPTSRWQQQQQQQQQQPRSHHHAAAAASSSNSTYYDWNNVHATYLQRSQCAALRAMKEGFFRIHAAAGPRAEDAVAARAASDSGDATGTPQQQQPHTIEPLSFPLLLLPSASSTQKKELLHPISSRYIGILPPLPPPPQRNVPHAAARDRSSNPTAAALASGNPPLELPDGTLLAADELATAIPEVLFRPQEMLQQLQQEEPWLQEAAVHSFKGIGQALREVAARVESVESRREILNGIILTGGCSAMPGLYERLNAELQNEPSLTHGLRWRLLAAPGAIERKFSSWIGGSILSSMGAFQSMWCSREEYAEHGPSIVERKCY